MLRQKSIRAFRHYESTWNAQYVSYSPNSSVSHSAPSLESRPFSGRSAVGDHRSGSADLPAGWRPARKLDASVEEGGRDPSGERSILKVSGSLCRLSKLESAAILISCPGMYFFLTLEPVTGPSDFSEDGPLRKSIVRPGKPLPLQILGHKLSVSLYQSVPHLWDRHCT